ncbi:ABC-type dipeptide/oligopeptide/nickel transport system ATPase component [Kineosphaera limosa]|uniref:Putative ABC transporter ATP-binding protein n=1 Tax=Kineosphaera limosa NBRC 100340 TaxID=1184609 RepID=K6VMK1_9MICO|nr:ABC transporter ATP-binding protein [Kineosphaera limosa]NYE01664.1 ABC-type dipeptide/oligopeptide/nickel transport system ATPase component [Kineosphaera limosa]GAB97443.1 putative ABC transporter ATP-binding protein [Kineosphaera limosa NBRC 100340]
MSAPAALEAAARVADGRLVVDGLRVQLPLPPRRTRPLSSPPRQSWVHAARGLQLQAAPGTVTAIVGESGCGKSVLAAALMGLLPAGSRVRGRVEVGGRDLLSLTEAQLTRVRGRVVGLVPQSASTHLNPVRTIGATIEETLRHHDLRCSAAEVLAQVGLSAGVAGAYPHEVSGGMAQRALVALALALKPQVLVADEPTSALDDSNATAVLALLRGHADAGHAVVLITHDLLAARAVADRVAVMYCGEFVEVGPARDVLNEPLHDYSRALLAALPERGLVPPPGSVSSLVNPDPRVCAWHARVGAPCGHRSLRVVAPDHSVACLEPGGEP